MHWNSLRWIVVGCLMLAVCCLTNAMSAEQNAAPEPVLYGMDAQGQQVELPTPPPRFAALIKQGDVRFEFYDPAVTTLTYRGETRFDFQYSYDSRSEWRLIEQDGRPALSVQVRYHNVKLTRKHRMLLPMSLAGPTLFDSLLTRHEFDHVAISSDTRLPKLLESMLRERNRTLVEVLEPDALPANGRPSDQMLARLNQQLVTKSSDRVFQDFVDLITIRYKELDQVSQSGRRLLTPEERERIVDSLPAAP